MPRIGEITQDAEGAVQWKVERFTSLEMNAVYVSKTFFCAGEMWLLLIRRVRPEGVWGGQRIELRLGRWINVGPRTLDVEYTFSVQSRDGHRHGKRRNRTEFEALDFNQIIGINLEEERMSDLVPDDTLTVLCQLERIDPTRATQLVEVLEQKAAKLDSVKKELENELLELKHQNEELTRALTDTEAIREKLQSLLTSSTESSSQFKKELEHKAVELKSIKAELGTVQCELIKLKSLSEELSLKMVDIEIKRENLQRLLTYETESSSKLKRELEDKVAELDSVRKEFGSKASELNDLKHVQEKTLTMSNIIESKLENLQSLLTSRTENSSQQYKELEQKATELESVKRELGNKQLELNKLKLLYEELIPKTTDIETSRENLQSLPTSGPVINVSEAYDFTRDFNHFFEEKTDVTFVLETPDGKKDFFAHQFVLARKSSYFADEFHEKQRNGEEQVVLFKNINPKAFRDMIRYCYDWEPCLRTTEEACALLEVAFQFRVMSLVNVCQAFLRDAEIEPGNVLSLLLVSRKTGDEGLAEKCNRLLQGKTREVIESHELRDVTPSMVRAILDLPMLSLCSEYDLLEWIFAWAKVKSQENGCESVREYLGDLLKDLNFLALTFEEFLMLCKDNHGFFSPAEFQSISMNIASPGKMEMPDWYDKDLRFRAYTGWKPKDNFVLNNNRNN